MANIYQAGSKAISKALSKGAPKKVSSAGAKGESVLAEKLGTAIAEKEAGKVNPEVQARLGAMEAMKLLQEEGTPTFKTTQADLQTFAKDNPSASPEELAAMYRGSAPEKPTPYRMKEKIEPISAPREIEDPASQEKIYEAYGRAANVETRFADEDSMGLEGLVSRPQDEVIGAGMGGLPADATLADRISGRKRLTAAQKTGVGLAAAGATGMALRGGEEKKPEQPAGLLRPKITGESYSDIKFEPSTTELEEANSKAGMTGVRALWNTYSALNDEFRNKVKTEGFTTSDPKAAASAFLQTKQAPTGPGILATPLTGDQFSAVQEPVAPKPAVTTATEKVKEKLAVTPAPPGGIAAKQRPQPKTIAESIAGQVKTAETAQDAASAITDKLASGQQLTRADMLGLVEKINSIQPTPAQADDATVKALRAAREEARQAYREQATRNEWSEVAQTVSNAIANFIAAQQGLAGKPLALPQVDYGERTARALREYQTELGAITEQERALERGVERKQAVAEREAEASRRGWERYLMLGEKQIESAERKAEKERDLATQLAIATAKREQEKAILDAAAKKEEKKAAKEGGKEQLSFLEKSIRQTEDLIKEAETKLKNATAVAAATDSKAFAEALPAYSIGSGVDLSQYSKAGLFSGEKYQQDEVKKQAKGRAAELSAELQRLTRVREEKLNQYDSAISGGQPTRLAAPAGQQPAPGGKVVGKAKLAEYAKQKFGGDEDAAQKFLESQGFSIGD